MQDLNLNQLKYFFDAASERSVAKAAQKNFVSQSAISQAIRKLGETLGTPLLVHGKNRFHLTDEGLLIFKRSQEIFAKLGDMQNELKSSQSEYVGELRFATAQSIALTLLPEKLRVFRDRYPLIVPKFKLGRTSLNRQWLVDGLVELVVTLDDGTFASFESSLLHRGKFVAIQLKGSEKKPAAQTYMIGGTYRPEVRKLLRFYEKKHRRPLPIGYEIESWEVITRFVFKGLGIGFVPDYIVDRYSPAEQKTISRLNIPDIRYEIYAFYKDRATLSKNASLFLETLTTPKSDVT